jgi:NRAMP (natural resistance-associated macrophage protein)-like metal ion transporter
MRKTLSWLKKLGPGFITGAADDDPSGIATYSQAGAQFGFNTLWTVLFTYPLMVGIQLVSARIGAFSGHGLATNIGRHFPRWLLAVIVSLLLFANVINIAADLVAMGDAVALIAGGPHHVFALALGLLSLALQVWVPYQRYVNLLKWLTLSLFAYVGTLFALHIDWTEVWARTVYPHVTMSHGYLTMIVAIFGTTISPYLFFWQASQEVEEQLRAPREDALKRRPEDAAQNVSRMKFDTCVGMGVSNAVAFFIMLTTAVTLHQHGVHDIQSSTQAASALKPAAGDLAFLCFSLGIVGSGMLAIPVLAGSAAYAMAGTFHWSGSLEHSPARSARFYGIIAVATLLGAGLAMSSVNTIEALFWSAVINGVAAAPVMALMMLLAVNREVMGKFVIGKSMRLLGWCATGAMLAAVAAMCIGLLR